MHLRQLFVELRRRKVLRTCAMYIVAAWVAIQVADMLFPAIDVPEEALRYVWLIAATLLPLVIVFSWRYDISAEGISRTPPAEPGDDFDPSLRRPDFLLLSALGVVALTILFEFGTRIEPGVIRLDASISPFSIAVLPFDDLSGDPDEQYFVSGMQSSLIDGLSRVRTLRVTSKVSTLPYRQAGGTLLEIAMQLGVARIVEGTVLRDGNRVSIALRMHDAEENAQVWSARFEDDLSNIMILQAEAAQEIANQVRVQLGPEEREQFAAARPVNPDAYLAALKGNFHSERFNPEDARIAEMHYRRAIDIDPEYAVGYWGLNKVCAVRAQAGMISPEEARKTCLPLAMTAMELDPFLPEAHMAMAGILTWHHFDWEAARPYWERALELNPSYAEAHIFYGHYLGIIGELDRSTEHVQKALELDPLNPFTVGLSGTQLAMAGRFEEAIAAIERSFAMSPGHAFGYKILEWANDTLGNEKEAIEAKVNNLRYAMGAHDLADFLAAAYLDGNYEMANLRFAEELVRRSDSGHVPRTLIAASYEQAGEYDLAMDWYEKAFEQGDPDTPYLGANIKDPELRHHPRFKLLLEKMGLHYWAENL